MEMYFILYFIMHIPTNNTVQVFWRSFIYAKFCISWCLAKKNQMGYADVVFSLSKKFPLLFGWNSPISKRKFILPRKNLRVKDNQKWKYRTEQKTYILYPLKNLDVKGGVSHCDVVSLLWHFTQTIHATDTLEKKYFHSVSYFYKRKMAKFASLDNKVSTLWIKNMDITPHDDLHLYFV